MPYFPPFTPETLQPHGIETAYGLSADAECGSPDSHESAGAAFLVSVRDDILDRLTSFDADDREAFLRDADTLEDVVHEVADGAVPIYTYPKWQAFVDLQAYEEDVTDLAAENADMESRAGTALYMIAERLASTLIAEVHEAYEETTSNLVDVALDAASSLGHDHGVNAAESYVMATVSRSTDGAEQNRRILDGILDGDPIIMDSLPSADLSGQWADGLTTTDLLVDVELNPRCVSDDLAVEVADAYCDAFNIAVQEAVEKACRRALGN
jgi:hypothetical protein